MAEEIRLKNRVNRIFQLNGFIINSEICVKLLENWNDNTEELEQWINRVIDYIQNENLEYEKLTVEFINEAIKECLTVHQTNTTSFINVISAFEVPKFKYDVDRKKFLKCESKKRTTIGPAIAKSNIFKERHSNILQRVLRNDLFKPTLMGDQSADVQLRTIESIISRGSKEDNVIILGLLTQLTEGKFYLEDPTGILQLDLSNVRFHNGFFTENCFVLCDGNYEDKVLTVGGMIHPPAELGKVSRELFEDINIFGGSSKTSLRNNKNLSSLEKNNSSGIVFLSEIWLDRPKVLQRLQVLFEGYNDCPPIAFVLCGRFISGEESVQQAYQLKTHLKNLADIISQYSNIVKKSTFIIIPGKSDPIAGCILPRPPLPSVLTEDFIKKVPNTIFATNPCRIQYCTQEIVVIREDIVGKMFRNTIRFLEKEEDVAEHFAKTIMGQAHLAPFTLNVLPIYWEYDYALSLYPLPDVLVVADKSKAFSHKELECSVINPGPFSQNDFSFKVYYPATKETEDSYIPPELT